METLDRAIDDYSAGVFLRYFRQGTGAGAESPHLDLARDMDLLRAHWALSEPVRTFLSYVLSHRHEAQSLLQFVRRTDDAVARGRIDARGTMLARRVAGHPSLVIYEEPVRSFKHGTEPGRGVGCANGFDLCGAALRPSACGLGLRPPR